MLCKPNVYVGCDLIPLVRACTLGWAGRGAYTESTNFVDHIISVTFQTYLLMPTMHLGCANKWINKYKDYTKCSVLSTPPILFFFLPSDLTLTSAVILASAKSSSWVSGRSWWAPRRLLGASCRNCSRMLVLRVCSLVDWRTDLRTVEVDEKDVREGQLVVLMLVSHQI